MTEISRDDVLHLAQLSNLSLDDDEISGLQADLDGILGYVNQLSKLDTDNVEPTYQVTDLENVWRDDEIINYDITREELLSRAADTTDGQVRVPKVL